MEHDYKKLWDILNRRLQETIQIAKETAAKTFEYDNKDNFEPMESIFFLEQIEIINSLQNIINSLARIEIRERLFLNHQKKQLKETKT